jgi:hypothetical protein
MNGVTGLPRRAGTPPASLLFTTGTVFVLIPIAVAIWAPDAYGRAQLYLRIIAALGAGLMGSFIPGTLRVVFPKSKALGQPAAQALGGLAVFLMVFLVNPLWEVDASTAAPPAPEKSAPAPSEPPAEAPSPTEAQEERRATQVAACVAERIAAHQQPKEKSVEGGARAPGPGIGGGTKRAEARICLSVGPSQEIIGAHTDRLSCHGGRCSVTAPVISGSEVCVVARAWSESKSFGGGGSGQYRLTAQYRDVATDEVKAQFAAECNAKVAAEDAAG